VIETPTIITIWRFKGTHKLSVYYITSNNWELVFEYIKISCIKIPIKHTIDIPCIHAIIKEPCLSMNKIIIKLKYWCEYLREEGRTHPKIPHIDAKNSKPIS
jgi:hypothetical protein